MKRLISLIGITAVSLAMSVSVFAGSVLIAASVKNKILGFCCDFMKKNIVIFILSCLVLILSCMGIKTYNEKQAAYSQNRVYFKMELADALGRLKTEDEQSYNNAILHFYGAYMIAENSQYFPVFVTDKAVLGFLYDYGIKFPDAFKAHIPELLQLEENVIALNTNIGGEKEFSAQLADLYNKIDAILVKISADFSN